jgi:hypothetical protein
LRGEGQGEAVKKVRGTVPLTSILSRRGRGRLRNRLFSGGLRGIFIKEFLILHQRESIRE